MTNIKKTIQILFGLVLIGGIFFAFWLMLNSIWKALSSLNDSVIAAIVAATATFLVSLISVLLGKYYERKLIIEKEMREKKIPVYNQFVEFLMNLLSNKQKMSEEEMVKFFKEFTQNILVWGSDEVITQWSKYRRCAIKDSETEFNIETMFELEKLLLAIRKDTGHKNSKVNRGDLLGLFINDIDDYIQAK